MNNVKLLNIKCSFFKFFSSPVALKNKKKCCSPRKSWNDAPDCTSISDICRYRKWEPWVDISFNSIDGACSSANHCKYFCFKHSLDVRAHPPWRRALRNNRTQIWRTQSVLDQSCPLVTFLGSDPTRPDPAKHWPDSTRDCRKKVWPGPTRPTARPFSHMCILFLIK